MVVVTADIVFFSAFAYLGFIHGESNKNFKKMKERKLKKF